MENVEVDRKEYLEAVENSMKYNLERQRAKELEISKQEL